MVVQMYSSECRNWCPDGKQVQTLPIYRDFKNTNVSVATKKSQSVAHTCGKRMELDWRTGSYANENKKTILPFRLTNRRRLNLHIKHSTNCEMVAKIQDI